MVLPWLAYLSLYRVALPRLIRDTVNQASGVGGRLAASLAGAVSWRVHSTRPREMIVAGLAVAILIADHTYVARRTGSIPCTLDCGETYHAHIAALNLYEFGLRYASGLEDVAASRRPAAHPTVYTHNANLGMYFIYLLAILGIGDVHAQAGWVWLPFAAGLLYLYLFIRSASGHGLLAALCLLNAATLYLMVTLWAFQPLRVFSWLLTFGPAYHLHRYAEARSRRLLHLIAAMVYLALSLGVDYPFALFSFFNVIALAVTGVVRLRPRRVTIIAGTALTIAFALRQLQVASVVGVRFWAADVAYTAARRVPLVGMLLPPPDEARLHSLYSNHGILKWPDPGAVFDPAQWLGQIVAALNQVLGTPVVIAGAVFAATVALLLGVAPARTPIPDDIRPLLAVVRIVVATVGAQTAAFMAFGGYFANFYGTSLAPLFVHWIVPLFGLTTYLLVANAACVLRFGRLAIPVGAALLMIFVAGRAERELRARRELPPHPYPGRETLQEMKGRSFVTYWISPAVSAYTHQWAAVLHEPRWRTIEPHDLPFEPATDFFFFFEADKQNPEYRQPEFLFVPAINVPWLVERRCAPLGGVIGSPVDGCSGLDAVARRLRWLRLYRRGPDFLLYDLRPAYAELDARVTSGQRQRL